VRFTLGKRVAIDPGYDRNMGDTTYDFAAVLEFGSEEGLLRYLGSRDHADLGRLFWETCESTIVLEVEAFEAPSESEACTLV
jgi:hypothetical protein